MNTQLIDKLEKEAEHLYVIIASAEPWSKQYEKDPASHAALITHEARLERAMRQYFKGLTDRVGNYVNWTVYQQKTLKAFDVNVTVNDDAYSDEQGILLKVVTDLTAEGIAIGAGAGESIYSTPLSLGVYSDVVQQTALKYSSQLVKEISDSTLKYIQKSLETSIKLGETTDEARARIDKMLGDPKRAGTIARTESVNSYQTGMQIFGVQSGAIGKEYQAIHGACQICSPLDGRIVPIKDDFSAEVGQNPPGHPNCRCGMRLVYQNELDDNPDLFKESEQ